MENKVLHTNSKGAEIFKKMLADKKFIAAFLKNGGSLSDLKDKYKFLDILSLQSKR